MEFQLKYFGLILSFLSNSWLRVVLDGQSSQEYLANAGVAEDTPEEIQYSHIDLNEVEQNKFDAKIAELEN